MASGTKLEAYKQLLINLLPKGKVWEPREQPVLDALLEALATELCRVDDRKNDLLITEADPRTATETLENWESMLGLPDECTPDDLNEIDRRNQVVSKLTRQGALNATFYTDLIDDLGFEGTVPDYNSFKVGTATVGDELTNEFGSQFQVGRSTVGEQLTNSGWQYVFKVEIPATSSEVFKVGENVVGNPLRLFQNELVQCTINQLKPAHTFAFYVFTE